MNTNELVQYKHVQYIDEITRFDMNKCSNKSKENYTLKILMNEKSSYENLSLQMECLGGMAEELSLTVLCEF